MALRKSMIKCSIRTPDNGFNADAVVDRDEIALAWEQSNSYGDYVFVVLKSGLQLTLRAMNLDKLWRGYTS
ncbi:hypothetical protein [Mycolicibacter sinensis]|uniref:hypothetical protein n=1 Tax=Mycolicibacter sinensis (strain JDM601) TaxID=875328 RepID=UPI001042564A|nr:hypothetical protein [Mycolicibacter sinensis]